MKKPEQKISKKTKRLWRKLTRAQQQAILKQAAEFIKEATRDDHARLAVND